MRLITDMIAYTGREIPKWNPINICSYHLQEAGRDAGAGDRLRHGTAIAVLDAVRDSGQVPARSSARSSRGSPSSSTRACASSKRCARCARSCSSGTS
jgi:hypothetical protein